MPAYDLLSVCSLDVVNIQVITIICRRRKNNDKRIRVKLENNAYYYIYLFLTVWHMNFVKCLEYYLGTY